MSFLINKKWLDKKEWSKSSISWRLERGPFLGDLDLGGGRRCSGVHLVNSSEETMCLAICSMDDKEDLSNI